MRITVTLLFGFSSLASGMSGVVFSADHAWLSAGLLALGVVLGIGGQFALDAYAAEVSNASA